MNCSIDLSLDPLCTATKTTRLCACRSRAKLDYTCDTTHMVRSRWSIGCHSIYSDGGRFTNRPPGLCPCMSPHHRLWLTEESFQQRFTVPYCIRPLILPDSKTKGESGNAEIQRKETMERREKKSEREMKRGKTWQLSQNICPAPRPPVKNG